MTPEPRWQAECSRQNWLFAHNQLGKRFADFLCAYNYAWRLKMLGGLTPYEHITKYWTSEPKRFIVNPIHQMSRTNS